MLNFPGFTSENHLLYQILLSLSPFSRLLSQVFCLMSPVSCLLSHVSVSHLISLSHIFCLVYPIYLLSHVSVSHLISLSHIFCLLSCVSYLSTVSRLLSQCSMSPFSRRLSLYHISWLTTSVSCLTSRYCLTPIVSRLLSVSRLLPIVCLTSSVSLMHRRMINTEFLVWKCCIVYSCCTVSLYFCWGGVLCRFVFQVLQI